MGSKAESLGSAWGCVSPEMRMGGRGIGLCSHRISSVDILWDLWQGAACCTSADAWEDIGAGAASERWLGMAGELPALLLMICMSLRSAPVAARLWLWALMVACIWDP